MSTREAMALADALGHGEASDDTPSHAVACWLSAADRNWRLPLRDEDGRAYGNRFCRSAEWRMWVAIVEEQVEPGMNRYRITVAGKLALRRYHAKYRAGLASAA